MGITVGTLIDLENALKNIDIREDITIKRYSDGRVEVLSTGVMDDDDNTEVVTHE